jgi:thioredoxin reductase (NADPH)
MYGLVERIEKIEGGYKTYVRGGEAYETKTIIIAGGSERKKLNVPGEDEYVGRGVSYCTTCDAPFYREKVVALIGGADAAVSGAIHTSEFADHVYIIYRKDQLRAEPIWVEEALKNPKIEVIYTTNITEIIGDGQKVTGVKLDKPYNNFDQLSLDGVFIEIGSVPGTSLASELGVTLDEGKYVLVNEDMSTNLPGIFAAGDLTDNSKLLPQMIEACAEGAIAAASVYKYLKGQQAPRILGV